MGRQTILVIDDEQDILELIRFNLEREGYSVETAGTAEEGLRLASRVVPDLVVLDLMLPGIDGMEACRRLRRNDHTKHIPVVMLTAKSEDSDVVAGLEVGADDYVTKPFSPRVLIARIRTALRRGVEDSVVTAGQRITIHGIVIDTARHEVTVDGTQIDLSATEFSILEFLARSPGWVFSRSKIIDSVKGKDYPVTERSVDVQILGLRRKLGEKGLIIQTVRGVGYRLEGE